MGRFLAGVLSALLLVGAGLFVWKSVAGAQNVLPRAPAALITAAASADAPLADPPQATEKTREEKRFSRYDHDKDGTITRDEYLASRRKAFAKLDTNGDGKLSFDEYAVKAEAKFAAADADKSGTLNAAEFATTRVVRKTAARRANCPPTTTTAAANEEDS